jgi:hypothetical protein
MILCGIRVKYEGRFRVTDVERARVSAIRRGAVYMVCSSVSWRKSYECACVEKA